MTRKYRLLMTALLAASAAAVSACSSTTDGAPSTSTSGASSSAPGSEQPTKVDHPLDPSAYLDKPCDLVPQTLVGQLGFSNPEPTGADSAFGPGCGWIDVRTSHSRNFNVNIQVLKGKRNGGLASVYKTRDAGGYDFAEPTDVSGYPAAFADTQDRRTEGKCSVYVGIADDLTFSAGVDGYDNAQDSCDAAKRIAAAVITTLQGGS
ncbi:DUF3558 domain-containing protein [Amycolatopsis acidicola]|uniref:DUF3558 domain-containing protein n=1 Tax=Amycolatopsis acidicola TaxID=2596893 RepID=A0A5N0VHD8_9PSEU|nr:DUF3558 domain-containing protein [Amycolatopsis acidicola]KAA9165759.1 DUF3558 domain-containing protein [Amycolatopsis acidicola]